MGQACNGSIISCVDTGLINTQEIVSEPSRKLDLMNHNQILRNESRDPIVNCIEKLDMPLTLYENEFKHDKIEPNSRKSMGLDESYRIGNSPKVKIISSNFCERSFNLIDRIERTAETDKSSSSLMGNNISK